MGRPFEAAMSRKPEDLPVGLALRCFGLKHPVQAPSLAGHAFAAAEVSFWPDPPERTVAMGSRLSPRTAALGGMILLAALSRLIPHPPNFAPITAIALFGAANFDRKWKAFLVPLAAMFLSDLGLEALYRLGLSPAWGLHPWMGVVYATFAVIVVMGLCLRGRTSPATVATMTLASSIVFFLVTNFAVWWLSPDAPFPQGFPKSAAGLIECYTFALGWFHWTLLGDATYATALFGGFAIAERALPSLRERAPVAG
jgi:hypothetical protein